MTQNMKGTTGLEQGLNALTGLRMNLEGRMLVGPAAPHPHCKKSIQIAMILKPHLADSLAI